LLSIFRKPEPQAQKARERYVPARGSVGDGAISIIGPGMVIEGDITTEGIVRIEGELRGTVRAVKAVILGQAGRVLGNIITDDAVIGGMVDGSIIAENRLELQSTCSVSGEIRTRAQHLKCEEGARFAGQVQMLEEDPVSTPTLSLPHQPGAPNRYDDEDAFDRNGLHSPIAAHG
jgi:cytoskeletal protein CcmA (bactofilin family)